jgi:hypothetical protein
LTSWRTQARLDLAFILKAIGVGVTGTRRLSRDPIEGGAVAIPTLLPIVDLSQALIAALYRSKST